LELLQLIFIICSFYGSPSAALHSIMSNCDEKPQDFHATPRSPIFRTEAIAQVGCSLAGAALASARITPTEGAQAAQVAPATKGDHSVGFLWSSCRVQGEFVVPAA
jgi:hypothetical protein